MHVNGSREAGGKAGAARVVTTAGHCYGPLYNGTQLASPVSESTLVTTLASSERRSTQRGEHDDDSSSNDCATELEK